MVQLGYTFQKLDCSWFIIWRLANLNEPLRYEQPKWTDWVVLTYIRAYLRASTNEQDATRARAQLDTFAAEHGLSIAATYIENESGAKLARPELFRLLSDAKPGDVLLVEQVDRLSRLMASDWEKLRAELTARHVRLVALDLPTSWKMANPSRLMSSRRACSMPSTA
jgi:hypothetical protein